MQPSFRRDAAETAAVPILVTGATGFVGKFAARSLVAGRP